MRYQVSVTPSALVLRSAKRLMLPCFAPQPALVPAGRIDRENKSKGSLNPLTRAEAASLEALSIKSSPVVTSAGAARSAEVAEFRTEQEAPTEAQRSTPAAAEFLHAHSRSHVGILTHAGSVQEGEH
jgi:hypothetical protein